MKVGDIFVAKWGYDQTNATFFEVTKVSEKQATLLRLTTDIEWKGNTMTGTAMPGSVTETAKARKLRRKILGKGTDDPAFRIESYMFARKWNGKPVNVTGYA